jgi:hypothetical protein
MMVLNQGLRNSVRRVTGLKGRTNHGGKIHQILVDWTSAALPVITHPPPDSFWPPFRRVAVIRSG